MRVINGGLFNGKDVSNRVLPNFPTRPPTDFKSIRLQGGSKEMNLAQWIISPSSWLDWLMRSLIVTGLVAVVVTIYTLRTPDGERAYHEMIGNAYAEGRKAELSKK